MFINRSDQVIIYVVIIIKLFSMTSALVSTTTATAATAANMKIQPLNAAAKAVLWDVGINFK